MLIGNKCDATDQRVTFPPAPASHPPALTMRRPTAHGGWRWAGRRAISVCLLNYPIPRPAAQATNSVPVCLCGRGCCRWWTRTRDMRWRRSLESPSLRRRPRAPPTSPMPSRPSLPTSRPTSRLRPRWRRLRQCTRQG
jgi:hypothetical protein